ncbi:Cof-type HAD-IIB family hydrolase [Clostridiaceae bacterium DONG20-135]|uniref:Cof-type HAD-IIB family hydrolase n=1 Tax=Copranaerobaculum intestinale TaxID=2692629 RepID=A0A6N8U8A8_9FIRM|nr:HAD family hydrolase [Copranaerobaculum intestinale]MXQ74436.1 Cof-type HAD-IIB family hydrolase [Copranaerobaculum intestinale]
MIKMIACDMDGTLLNSENQLSEANRMAVLAAQRSGIRFVVATGRGRQNVIDLLQKKDIQCGSILLNGAVYMDEQQQQLFSLPLSKPAANKAYQVFHKYELFSRIFCEDGFYSEAKKVRLMHDMLARLGLDHEFSEEELYTMAEEDDFIGITKPLIAWEETLNQQHIYKLEAFRYGSPNLEMVCKELAQIDDIAVTSSFANNIEVTNILAQKGQMLEKVAAHYGLMHSEVMVIGDSMNDLSMFRSFSNSVAVANADIEVRKAASQITDSNDQMGVAKILFRTIESNRRLQEF